MTILAHLIPDQSPWSSLWDWSQDWAPSQRGLSGPWFDSWREPVSSSPISSSRGIQIPIQIVHRHGYQKPELWDEWSDSDCDDCDDYNMNTNSRRPRKRRSTETATRPSTVRHGPSTVRHDSPPPVCIDLENDSTEAKWKVPLRESCNRYADDVNLTRSSRYRTRSSDNNLTKANYIICDSDTENDINATCDYTVYEYLKAFLNSTGRQVDAIKGDGNCFFRALSKVIYGNQSYYNEIRQAVVDVIEEYPKKFEAFADGPVAQHIKSMREDKTWATQTEIYAAATLLNRDIYILSPDQTGDTYRWLLFKPQFKYNSSVTGCSCYITICHTHGNHYDRIAAVKRKCNCGLEPPEMSGIKESVDLTGEDEIV